MPLSTVLDYARRGILPGHKLGRRWIFLRDEIEAGVRDAPSPAVAEHPEPPARQRLAPAQSLPKRYPQAVPAAPQPDQAQLFG
jgi:hypothetical protein